MSVNIESSGLIKAMNDLKDPVNDVDDTISDRKVGLLDHRLGHVVLADDGDLVAGGLGEELGPADGSEAAVGEGGLEVGAGHQVLVDQLGGVLLAHLLHTQLAEGLVGRSKEGVGTVREVFHESSNLNNLQKLGDFSLFLDHVSNGILVGREEEAVDHVDDTVVSFNRLYNPFSID